MRWLAAAQEEQAEAEEVQVRQLAAQSWQTEEALRKAPAAHTQLPPLRSVPWAGLQAVQPVAVTAQARQRGSQAEQRLPLRKYPGAQRHCPPESTLPAAQAVQLLLLTAQVRHDVEHATQMPPAS